MLSMEKFKNDFIGLSVIVVAFVILALLLTSIFAHSDSDDTDMDIRYQNSRKVQCRTYGGMWRDSDKSCSFDKYEIISCLQNGGLYNFGSNVCEYGGKNE